jgi:hypothetical protein
MPNLIIDDAITPKECLYMFLFAGPMVMNFFLILLILANYRRVILLQAVIKQNDMYLKTV